jgi:hypothetical protein
MLDESEDPPPQPAGNARAVSDATSAATLIATVKTVPGMSEILVFLGSSRILDITCSRVYHSVDVL